MQDIVTKTKYAKEIQNLFNIWLEPLIVRQAAL